MERLQCGSESRPSVHSTHDTGPMVQLVMGPMKVSDHKCSHVLHGKSHGIVVSATHGGGSVWNRIC